MFQTTNQILYDIIPYPDKILICWSHPLRESLLKPRAMGFISVSSCAYMGPQGPVVLGKIYGFKLLKTRCFFTTTHGKCGFHLWNIYGKSVEHLCNIYVRPCQTLICLQDSATKSEINGGTSNGSWCFLKMPCSKLDFPMEYIMIHSSKPETM